jgi:hypothetical protein
MNSHELVAKLRDFAQNDPLTALAVGAAMFALATTPLAFAVLGRTRWFQARRGRTLRRPSFAAVVCGMLLVMGVPAIFTALVVKSRHFDENRYAFDPNTTWSVIEQGRGYRTLEELNEAIRAEMQRLDQTRKGLVNHVKKLDEAMLKLRAVAGTSPAVAETIPGILERLADVRRSVGVDAPQQLMDFTAPPVELAPLPGPAAPAPTAASSTPTLATPAPAAVSALPDDGLSQAQVEAELAGVPEPQRPLAATLPLTDLPTGWAVGKSGEKHLETFNADNLFEKIDGRAESFIQYDVRGMAYTYYHPTGDESNEVQVYIFQMGDALKALGKYGSEKPDKAKPLAVGSEGYTTAGSTLFHAGPYYTQIVSTQDDKKFADFTQELAKRIAEKQRPKEEVASTASGVGPATVKSTPDTLFALLPGAPGKSGQKFIPRDVFGYSFLSDVFMADYQEGEATWQGFLRPYPDARAAREVFDKYVANAKQDGAELKKIDAEGADQMVVSSYIGLVDAIFQKGNVLGGANGATDAKCAEVFARAFVQKLPPSVPMIESAPDKPAQAEGVH